MKTAYLLWCNAVEEINQQVFHNKASSSFDRYEFAHLNASSWHSLSKQFKDFSMQDILVNWQVFIFPLCWSFRFDSQPFVLLIVLEDFFVSGLAV